jgi:hypothetical protein
MRVRLFAGLGACCAAAVLAGCGNGSDVPASTGGQHSAGSGASPAGAAGLGGTSHSAGASGTEALGGSPGSGAAGRGVGGAGASDGGGSGAGAGGVALSAGTGGRGFDQGGRAGEEARGGVGGGGAASGGAGSGAGGALVGVGMAGTAGSGGAPATDATIVPDASWACGMAGGLPPPAQGKVLFKATVDLGELHDVGVTQYGHRRVLDLNGGTITGDKLQATLVKGGLDYELALSNQVLELEQLAVLKASDGTLIFMRTCGVAPAGDSTARMVFDFEVATSSSLAFLNDGKYVGTRVVDTSAKKLELAVYDVAGVMPADPRVTVSVPAGLPARPWECNMNTGQKGTSVFTEQVGIGSSLSVGASKRGTRNIIPITGGTVSGRFTGTVVPGGADFQIVSGGTKLDARYALKSDDGEYVVVRNCGPIGSLVPWFETRADGPYAFLNTSAYLSSDPGTGGSGVSITFYERK